MADRVRGEEPHLRGHLPERGLHPVQGAAQQFPLLSHGQARLCRKGNSGVYFY